MPPIAKPRGSRCVLPLLLMLLLMPGPPAWAQPAAGAAAAPGAPPVAPLIASAPFTWTVQRPADPQNPERAPVVHRLVGSVHLLPQSAYPLPSGLQAAYAETAGLILETDPSALEEPEFQKRFLEAARAPAGLRSTIEPVLYQQLLQRTAQLRLPETFCDAFRAWFCALSVELYQLQSHGVSGQLGLDRHFYARALRDERGVRWLEEPGQQLAIFSTMNDAQSQQFLAATLQGMGEIGGDPVELVHQWRNNDQAAMERVVTDMRRQYPEPYERLLASRNRAWVPRLEALFGESRPLMVVVGAAHLLGLDGVPTRLTARGWIVTPLMGTEPAPSVAAPPLPVDPPPAPLLLPVAEPGAIAAPSASSAGR